MDAFCPQRVEVIVGAPLEPGWSRRGCGCCPCGGPGARHKNLKELRRGSSGRSETRILFAFDPRRRAILLVAGDKAGNWQRWYIKNIPIAEARYDEHLRALKDRP